MFIRVSCFVLHICNNKFDVTLTSTYLLLKIIMKVNYLVIRVLAECAKADYIYIDVAIKITNEIILYLQTSGMM